MNININLQIELERPVTRSRRQIMTLQSWEPITFNEDVWKDLHKQKELKCIPTFLEYFLITHLTAVAKKKKSRLKIMERYTSVMVEKYGEDLTQHLEGHVDLWVQAQKGEVNADVFMG
ncbi:unnamed protein product [Lactuca saligna]|uniref:Uncharacterized protein n=1 Tax=Lactuca saligna TaxID=75948 RepID=A0AA36E3V4_LACSI|nr:unnamed protein product [Lactuca saligna]